MADTTLLDRMHPAPNAEYRSGNRQGCMRGTRRGVLLMLENWLRDEQGRRVLWLNGLAGTGKSTIAQTFAEMSFADGKLGASFFCSRDFEDRRNLRSIFPTLAFQLAHRYPQFQQGLLSFLAANPNFGQESICSQLENLLIGPLQAMHTPTLIIIDALDECHDEGPASALLSMLSHYMDKIPLIKSFITGRPEPQIRSGFRLELLQPHIEVFKLHEVEPDSVNSDIKIFLKARLAEIAKNRSIHDLTEGWPSLQDISIVCRKAAGFFIYASTVINFVASNHHSPIERLSLITSLPQDSSYEGGLGIDLLYTQVLDQAFNDHNADLDGQEHFKLVVGAVLLVFKALSVKALSTLLRIPNVSTTLCSLDSLLLIPTNEAAPVQIFHKSFPHFLMDQKRCKDPWFFVNPSVHHARLLQSCLSLMKERLKRNICNLGDYAILNEVKDLSARHKRHIGDALVYACRFWTSHLTMTQGSGLDIVDVQKAIEEFFTTCLLYWIEVLSLTGNLSASIHALRNIQQWYTLVSSVGNISQGLCSYVFRWEFHAGG